MCAVSDQAYDLRKIVAGCVTLHATGQDAQADSAGFVCRTVDAPHPAGDSKRRLMLLEVFASFAASLCVSRIRLVVRGEAGR